jgi:hypothetical protein
MGRVQHAQIGWCLPRNDAAARIEMDTIRADYAARRDII